MVVLKGMISMYKTKILFKITRNFHYWFDMQVSTHHSSDLLNDLMDQKYIYKKKHIYKIMKWTLYSWCIPSCILWFSFPYSSYPSNRVTQDSNEVPMGVAGSVNLLQNVTMSTQPIAGFDWSPDKMGLCVCTAFDQCLRVLIVTKLNRVWDYRIWPCMARIWPVSESAHRDQTQ